MRRQWLWLAFVLTLLFPALSEGQPTGVSALFSGSYPAGNRCVEINSTGQLVAAADTCGNLGPGAANSFGTIGAAVADSAGDSMTVTDSATIDFTTTNDPEDITADFLPAGVNDATWGDNTDATIRRVFDQSGVTLGDPYAEYGDGTITLGLGATGNEIVQFVAAAAAPQNYLEVTANPANQVKLKAEGSDTNVDLLFASKGGAAQMLFDVDDDGNYEWNFVSGTLGLNPDDDATNEFLITSLNLTAGTANGPAIQNEASSNTNPTFVPHKSQGGTGIGGDATSDNVSIIANSVEAARFNTAASGVTYIDVTPGATGVGPTIAAAGEANLDIVIAPAGSGAVDINLDCSAGDQYLTTNASGQISCGTDNDSGGTPTQIVQGDSDCTVTDAGTGDVTCTVDASAIMVIDVGGVTLGGADATDQLILPSSNDAATPTLAFGVGADTGFYENASGSLTMTSNGVSKWQWSSTFLGSNSVSGTVLRQSGVNLTTTPGLMGSNDTDTGIGFDNANGLSAIAGGVRAMNWNTAASGVTYVDVTPGATGVGPTIASAGEANVDLTLDAAGTGNIEVADDIEATVSGVQARLGNDTGASNITYGFIVDTNSGFGRAAADAPAIYGQGAESVRFTGVASAVNYLDISPAIATAEPQIAAAGTDTDVSIILAPKGAGTIDINLDCSAGDQYLTTNAEGEIACGTDNDTGGTPTQIVAGDSDITMADAGAGTGTITIDSVVVGTWDAGGLTMGTNSDIVMGTNELVLWAGNTCAVNNNGEICVDIDGDASTLTQGVVRAHVGSGVNTMIPVVDAFPTVDGQRMEYDSGTNKMVWAASPGGGDVTAVGPGCATGECLTDGLATTGTTLMVWEGNVADAEQVTFAMSSAEPAAAYTLTFPDETGNILSDGSAGGTDLTCTGGVCNVDSPVTSATSATNATNLALDPTDCGANTWATTIDAQGDLTCSAISGGAGITDATVAEADLATADFGDFSCGAGASDCVLDTGAVSATEIETAPAISGANIDSFPENFCKTLFDSGGLADTDDISSLHRFKGAATVTEVWCETDTGTATITLEDGSGNDLATSCSCDATGDTGNTCTLTNTTFTDGELLDLLMVTAAGNRLTFCVEYDLD